MNPMEALSSCFRAYVNFSGRAQRSEFWWFFLFYAVFHGVLFTLANTFVGPLLILPSLAVLSPFLAVMARRLHDTGRSVSWLLICVVIILGWALLIAAIMGSPDDAGDGIGEEFSFIVGLVLWLFLAAIWFLVSLVGLVLLAVILGRRGTRGPNRYGPDPLAPELGPDPLPEPDYPHAPPRAAGGYTASLPGSVSSDTPAAPGPLIRVYCPKCGKERTAEARFCVNCGTEL